MKDRDVFKTDAPSLTPMMEVEAGGGKLWGPEELGAILEHQLAAPLQVDLGSLDPQLPRRLEQLNGSGGPSVRTFRDLLGHPRPPLKLLELTKQFAKACRNHPHSPLPDEIATVLYFLSIVVAMTRCGHRITKMDDPSLAYSLDWAVRQPWLDGSTRAILREGIEAVGSSAREPPPGDKP